MRKESIVLTSLHPLIFKSVNLVQDFNVDIRASFTQGIPESSKC